MSDHQDAAIEAEPTVAGPQSEAAVTSAAEAATTAAPSVLTSDQRTVLRDILDTVVPPDGGLPGAGGLGVGDSIDATLARAPGLRRLFLDGLAEVAVASARVADADFAGLDADGRERVLRAVEEASPIFFAALVEHAYRGYYTHPTVHAAIGYPTRPPQPLGHTLAPFREELLQIQKQRAPFWRPAPA